MISDPGELVRIPREKLSPGAVKALGKALGWGDRIFLTWNEEVVFEWTTGKNAPPRGRFYRWEPR